MEYRVCTKGVWDTSVPGITFDDNGVSNYAHFLQSLFDKYPRGEQGLEDWNIILSDIKRKGEKKKYDCIIGVSGGTDSCYMLHMAKEWGLRPLAINVDNGFNSKISVENIRKVTKKLNIDFKTYIIDYDLVKKTLTSYMKASLPWIDVPTDIAIISALYMYAKKYGVKYILNGRDFRSEGKQPFIWTASDATQMKYLVKKYMHASIKGYPHYSRIQYLALSTVYGIQRVHPFNYIDYDKPTAREFLINEYGWEYYGEHHHENSFTKFAIAYWLYEKFGIDKRIITYSSQVLSGSITRNDALAILKNKPYDKNTIDSEIHYILKKLSISQSDFDKMMKSPNKYVFDYPSDMEFFIRHPKSSMWIAKHLFHYEPLFLKQMVDGRIQIR